MKINMAEIEYFSIGSMVSCTTCYNQNLHGEVLAFDHASKMLILKSNSKSNNGNSNVQMVNLNYAKDVKITREASSSPPPLTSLNIAKLTNRVKKNIEYKRRQISYIGVDVSAEGQLVFNAITKTLDDVSWDDKTINVMKQVVIVPPYDIDNITLLSNGTEQALQHVRKIVSKHWSESSSDARLHRSSSSDLRKSLSPSPSSTSSS